MCRRWSLCWPVAGRDPGRAHDEQFLSTRKVTLAVSALKSGQSVSPGTRARPAHPAPRTPAPRTPGAPGCLPRPFRCARQVAASGRTVGTGLRCVFPHCWGDSLQLCAPVYWDRVPTPVTQLRWPRARGLRSGAVTLPWSEMRLRLCLWRVLGDGPVFLGLLCASAAHGRRLAALALTRGGDVGVSQLGMPSPRELGC